MVSRVRPASCIMRRPSSWANSLSILPCHELAELAVALLELLPLRGDGRVELAGLLVEQREGLGRLLEPIHDVADIGVVRRGGDGPFQVLSLLGDLREPVEKLLRLSAKVRQPSAPAGAAAARRAGSESSIDAGRATSAGGTAGRPPGAPTPGEGERDSRERPARPPGAGCPARPAAAGSPPHRMPGARADLAPRRARGGQARGPAADRRPAGVTSCLRSASSRLATSPSRRLRSWRASQCFPPPAANASSASFSSVSARRRLFSRAARSVLRTSRLRLVLSGELFQRLDLRLVLRRAELAWPAASAGPCCR